MIANHFFYPFEINSPTTSDPDQLDQLRIAIGHAMGRHGTWAARGCWPTRPGAKGQHLEKKRSQADAKNCQPFCNVSYLELPRNPSVIKEIKHILMCIYIYTCIYILYEHILLIRVCIYMIWYVSIYIYNYIYTLDMEWYKIDFIESIFPLRFLKRSK